jgi:putative hydrolase of the HAD superfamily
VNEIRAVVSDFGGVLTAPLLPTFIRAHADLGIPLEALGAVMRRGGQARLHALERGELSEPDFLAAIQDGLSDELGRPVSLDGYGRRLFDGLDANERLFDYFRALRDRGLRLAILTNNVREWEPLWRAKLPIDEVFELVVDSAFVGLRKPEPEIYALTLERLGLPAQACAFLDDLEINVDAARALGMHGIHFADTEQAIRELESVLAA